MLVGTKKACLVKLIGRRNVHQMPSVNFLWNSFNIHVSTLFSMSEIHPYPLCSCMISDDKLGWRKKNWLLFFQACIITRSRDATIDTWNMDSKHPNWYILETNYDHWTDPPFYNDRRTPANKCMQKLSQKVSHVSKSLLMWKYLKRYVMFWNDR